MEQQTIEWDESLLEKYNISGPRYTSYPTALEFSEDFQQNSYIKCLNEIDDQQSVSLYIHIPFCQNICYYCACNKIITKHKDKAEKYVKMLIKEIRMVGEQVGDSKLRQIHWGGGTPTYLEISQIDEIMAAIFESFEVPLIDSTEISIEIDPRAIEISDIEKLSQFGFNRMSMGVQDFNSKVQKAVNRIQSFEMTKDMIDEARKYSFRSINLDLIYGLPYQTRETFKKTLEQVIEISPDRISVFNYAHLPSRFKPQRRIDAKTLPSAKEKLTIFHFIIEELQNAGYVYIGMDHFAKPDDELAVAQRTGELHRNFQGYTTHKEYELIGVGVSSIGNINGNYHQNVRDIESYYNHLERGEFPSWRGVTINHDDKIRKAVIFSLICHFEVSIQNIESEFEINFEDYFATEIKMLSPFIKDGLVEVSSTTIRVTNKGRLLIRNICMLFDAYFNELQMASNFSKVL